MESDCNCRMNGKRRNELNRKDRAWPVCVGNAVEGNP